jgi:hypothetical protein
MKNFKYLFAFLAIGFIGCEPDTGDESYMNNRDVIASFTSGSSTIASTIDGDNSMILTVAVSKSSSAPMLMEIEIDPMSDAVLGTDFTMSAPKITIPANELSGSIEIVSDFDEASFEGKTLILNLKAPDGTLVGANTKCTVTIIKLCDSDLAGTYEMTTTFGYHDYLPDFNPNTITVELEAVEGSTNSYTVNGDFTGGLWGDLYEGAYGTSARDGVVITDICSVISWDQIANSDQFGGTIIYGDTSSYVDPETGDIYISWVCTGYGESGVAVLEPK